eukprot:TRINITY_DN36537_c0_g1_i1.p1 TRINITY_DN36537_c0_g1~~TRINITY_DN36537_c0_g1_i1.p1  ORF type:complete len:136 (-),score=18.81 TRINITY_DN36537_c0_g1_i1:105-455(-)
MAHSCGRKPSMPVVSAWLWAGLLMLVRLGDAFVCPPATVAAAPKNQQEGAACGGTCDAKGHCTQGLVCVTPKPKGPVLLLGGRFEGVCKKPPSEVEEGHGKEGDGLHKESDFQFVM